MLFCELYFDMPSGRNLCYRGTKYLPDIPACTIDRDFYRDAILDAVLLFLLTEQTTAFVRVYHLQVCRGFRRDSRRDSRRDWSCGSLGVSGILC